MLAASGEELTPADGECPAVRDAGLADAGRAGVVTYSRKVFIPLTRSVSGPVPLLHVRDVPSQLAKEGQAPFLSADEVLAIAREGAALGCKEALFTLGDRPEDRWPEAQAWLEEAGYDSTLEYLRAMAILVLEETGSAAAPEPRGDVAGRRCRG